jgi:hypothetical protein
MEWNGTNYQPPTSECLWQFSIKFGFDFGFGKYIFLITLENTEYEMSVYSFSL